MPTPSTSPAPRSTRFANFTDGPLPNKVGYYTENAAVVTRAVSIPVITVGRMLPEVGEQMITEGHTDFVAMGRQLLADPRWSTS